MPPRPASSPVPARLGRLAAAALWLALPTAAWAQSTAPSSTGIYTCTDEGGRRLTSDRPIAACSHKEQLLLNRDGSVRAVIAPTLTADERAGKEARERKLAEERSAQQDAVRRDRNLVHRFPNEAAHRKAREAASDTTKLAIKNTEARLRELERERKPLMNEAEFYPGRPLPPLLKQQIEANDAAQEAQRSLATTQQAELDRINALYDAELERLRKLWSGATPGSLGPLPNTAPPARPAARPPASAAAPASK